MYKVVRRYLAAYPDAFKLQRGDRVRFERRPSEWSGWIWCTRKDGRQGWIPESWADLESEYCTMTREYDATELTVTEGELVELLLLESDWGWAVKKNGMNGWVPMSHLERA